MADMHLSYSSLSMYTDCGRRWQGHYRQGLKSVPGEALVFGSLAHKIAEAFVADNNVDPLEMWKAEWAALMETDARTTTLWDSTPDDARETGIRLFSSPDTLELLSTIKPKRYECNGKMLPMIEREIHLKFDGIPDIIGYIDCIADDGVPIDFKTAGRMWAPDKAVKEVQPLFYLMALEQLGEHDHGFKFRHVVMTKAKTPRIEIFESQRSEVEFEFLKSLISRAWLGISSGVFLTNPTSWLCDPNYCGAWAVCKGAG